VPLLLDAVSSHPSEALPPVRPFEADPELLALPAPPKKERALTVVLMVLTACAAALVAWMLRGEAAYAFSSGEPAEVGDLAAFRPGDQLRNHYVSGVGSLGASGAIRYGRAAEGDSFRLAPVAGNDRLWIEIRVPEGFEGPRFIPPSSFAGRLVPLNKSGLRHASLGQGVERTGVSIPEDAWILVDGSSPRASRWAAGLCALFICFSLWNLVSVVRLLGRVKDGEPTDQGDAS